MAIWSLNKYVVGGLTLLILGHWSLILQGMSPFEINSLWFELIRLSGVQLTAVWVDGAGCQIIKTNNKILAAIFIYSMVFDLTVLLLNIYKLVGVGSSTKSSLSGRSRLVHMIFTDGLIFFFIA
jgi:hypothetical protein